MDDLAARRRLGVERPNVALQLQKLYDTFSHSAIFLWWPSDPSLFEFMSVRWIGLHCNAQAPVGRIAHRRK